MRRFRTWAALLLIFALLPAVPVNAENDDDRYMINDWIVAKYEVSQDVIYPGDTVDIHVWLYNAADVDDVDVAPEVSSFNDVQQVDKGERNESDGYLPVSFFDARYMGEGNTFMMRVDGEVLTLTIHECVPDSELTRPQDQITPVLQVGRHDQPKAIAKGETQTVTLWVNNISHDCLYDVVATVSPSSDLQIADNSVTYPLGDIWARNVTFFDVTLYAFGEISSAAQSLDISIGYSYEKDDAFVQGTATHTVPLSAVVSKPAEGAVSVPNVIVSGYDYGADKVMAGTSFDLALTFKNTSSYQTVENMVMTIDPGTALAITSSANSFHFASLAPGSEQTQTINLQALPDAPSAPASVKVGFRYEYPDGQGRQTASAEQTISLPVYQLDRFEVTQPSTYAEAWQYQESFLSLQYINKGKGTVYNVSASISDDIPAMERVQNVGNIAAGADGTIDFIITPEQAGDASCTVTVTYEDEAMQVFTKEFTFDLFVNEMFVPEEVPMEEIPVEEQTGAGLGWLWICLGIAAAGGVTVLLVLRKKKKKASNVVDTFTFDDTQEDVHVPT